MNIYTHRRTIITAVMMMFCTLYTWAQTTVTGVVYDQTNLEVIGANVTVKGTTIGTITNIDGKFTLRVDNPQKAVLEISYIGMKTKLFPLKGKTNVRIVLEEAAESLAEVTVVAYGTQKKETLTGAISAVNNDALLKSPNASVANGLAGQITGLSTVSTSGQPGQDDPKIFIRGVGSLTEGASSPLVLVDGVERSFSQLDPNEIESVSVLKDASATAVFGVRGANGVIIVTTRRGKEGQTRVSVNSSVGLQSPTRTLRMVDSYNYALLRNEMVTNDFPNATEGQLKFTNYDIERFQKGDQPLLYPNMNWREYLLRNSSIQTQHNINISGGTSKLRYFISLGFLYQDGLLKQFSGVDYNNNFKYKRYNYRANLDFNATKTTTLKLGIGGRVGDKQDPHIADKVNGLWELVNQTTPFSSPGVIEGRLVRTPEERFRNNFGFANDALPKLYGTGYNNRIHNTMNIDIEVAQKLDAITKGLTWKVKGAYNTTYHIEKQRKGNIEEYYPFWRSTLENPGLSMDDANFNSDIVYRVEGKNQPLGYTTSNGRARDWYFETSLNYKRCFGNHNVSALLLYNQSKKYYPYTFTAVPTAYIGFVGRITYDYKTKYLGEVDFGYNGSENFAPGKRFGAFPAASLGYILSEEKFMKGQKLFDYLKLRASIGLVGNDKIGGNRFLFLPDTYKVNLGGIGEWGYFHGFPFGGQDAPMTLGALGQKLGNSDVTWETSLKRNYGFDAYFLKSRLKLSFDYFLENRKDILIERSTLPIFSGLDRKDLPAVNLGKVNNRGYEIDLKWKDNIGKVNYYVNANMSYAKNKIVFMDEVTPAEPYMALTGHQVGSVLGYVADGFYQAEDFDNGVLKNLYKGNGNKENFSKWREEHPDAHSNPNQIVKPGDVKYKDLNGDGIINENDRSIINKPNRPAYTFGLNYGVSYKGWSLSMNWTAAKDRDLILGRGQFRAPFGTNRERALMQYLADSRWTPETAYTAETPRFTDVNAEYNMRESTMWVRDGSFIKLKNLTLGYTFNDKKTLKKLGVQNMTIKFTGYNLLTFDSFDIMDPECNPNKNDSYPIIKIYNLGINLTF